MANMRSKLTALLSVLALSSLVSAQVGPVVEVDKWPEVHQKTFAYLKTIGPECNFWKDLPEKLLAPPWPANCRVF